WGYAADASGGGYQLGLALLLPMTLGSALVALLVRRAVRRTMALGLARDFAPKGTRAAVSPARPPHRGKS
ncbi:hypothetical protein ABTE62_19840, partial [Acinetobacter baumannii]